MLFTLRMADSDVSIIWKLLITEKQGEGERMNFLSIILNTIPHFSNVGIKLSLSFVKEPCLGE